MANIQMEEDIDKEFDEICKEKWVSKRELRTRKIIAEQLAFLVDTVKNPPVCETDNTIPVNNEILQQRLEMIEARLEDIIDQVPASEGDLKKLKNMIAQIRAERYEGGGGYGGATHIKGHSYGDDRHRKPKLSDYAEGYGKVMDKDGNITIDASLHTNLMVELKKKLGIEEPSVIGETDPTKCKEAVMINGEIVQCPDPHLFDSIYCELHDQAYRKKKKL
jgi:hypothetical protein